ncbi:hypothetical protein [Methyloradius palustris]|uniref:Uncharacterized protein n=1 Tax=Methyloradius palustris TaxID=2778876 RepID=A0A8D5GEA9_9PROT|nr:hypothetical protein [Methyloradius palustris]BCM25089.1 hypothetical protein ZMTM_13480 [Methyloradius palustris]
MRTLVESVIAISFTWLLWSMFIGADRRSVKRKGKNRDISDMGKLIEACDGNRGKAERLIMEEMRTRGAMTKNSAAKLVLERLEKETEASQITT